MDRIASPSDAASELRSLLASLQTAESPSRDKLADALDLLSYRVAGHFVFADRRFQPPKQIVNGVDSGELDPKVLLIWKYTVERLGDKFNFGAGTAYWRNKVKKERIPLPAKYDKGGEGATHGPWKIKSGDQIEDWVRAKLASEDLINEAGRSVADWELEISHLKTEISDAQALVEKHKAGLATGKRVKQRTEWLAGATANLKKATKDLDKATAAVAELQKATERHETHQSPTIAFEKTFQAALSEATNDLKKHEVLDAARAALAKFEAELEEAAEMEEIEEAPITQRSPMVFQAGVGDAILVGLKKLWSYVTGAFEGIVEWAKDIVADTKAINKLLSQAGAR